MARKLKSDKVLFIATLLLVCASVVIVYSASAVLADQRYHQPYLFLTKQGLWTMLGLAMLAVTMRVDYRTYKNDRFIWALLGAVGLMLVAVLFSRPVNNARRWFGLAGIGVQPSEFAKLVAIIFIAQIDPGALGTLGDALRFTRNQQHCDTIASKGCNGGGVDWSIRTQGSSGSGWSRRHAAIERRRSKDHCAGKGIQVGQPV